MIKKLLLGISLLFVSICVFGQDRFIVVVHPYNESFDNNSALKDSSQIPSFIQEYTFSMHSEGYLLVSFDSLIYKRDTAHIYFDLGNKYYLARLSPGNLDPQILNKVGFKDKLYSNKPFSYEQVAKLEERIISYAENSGHPFAAVQLDSIEISGNSIRAVVNYKPGPLIKYDSIELIGTTKVKVKYLQRYLGIIHGEVFQEKQVALINKGISRLPFIEQDRPLHLYFRDNKSKIILSLKDRKVNYFDGIVGILPNSTKQGKVLFTGEANINLQNLFGTGKKIKGEWKKYNEQSQLIDFFYQHPVILGSSLDLSLNFNLLKQDSSFMNIDRGLKLSQSISKYGKIGILANLKTSRSLNGVVVSSNPQNDLIDFNNLQYGLSYEFENLDNIFLPKKGWELLSYLTVGNKQLKNLDSEIKSGNTVVLNQKNSIQYMNSARLSHYNVISKRLVLLKRLNAAMIYNNKGSLYNSDLFRVGGLTTLRGFNEKNFYASQFAIGTLEAHYFLDPISYLLIFIDQAYIQNSLNKAEEYDYPTGFGAGLSFSTGAGIFTFIYSLGRSNDQMIAFNLSKIHFGFTSKF